MPTCDLPHDLADGPSAESRSTLSAAAGYLTPGLKKFVDTLARARTRRPSNVNNLGQYIPVAVRRHHHLPGYRLLRDRARPVPPDVLLDFRRRLLRGYVQLSTPDRARPGAASRSPDQRQPRPDPSRAPPRCLPDGTTVAAHRSGQRPGLGVDIPHYLGPTIVGHEGQAGPSPVPQPAAQRCGRRPVPANRHHAHGFGHGPERGDTRRQRRADGHGRSMTGTVARRSAQPDVRCAAQAPAADGTATRRTGPRCTCTVASPRGSVTAPLTSGSPRPARAPHYPKGVSVSNVPDMAGSRPRRRDVLLHQPAERPPDVLPRPCVGHHPPERVCR